MGMVVRTNTMAINANRQLGLNNSQVAKSLEKLSSGFKINRAADDASGLAISEKMKAQIKGLEQASANSQDGISLVQTAEGAATEIHDMLNRMVELATKSANGTIQDEVDREAIQREVDDLNAEITRIAKSTNFNGINLLDGNLSSTGSTSGVSTLKTDLKTEKINAVAGEYHAATAVTAGGTLAAEGDKVSYTVALDNGKSHTVTLTYKEKDGAGLLVDDNGKEYDATLGSVAQTEIESALVDALKNKMGNDFKISGDGSGNLHFTSTVKGASAPKVASVTEKYETAALETAGNGPAIANATVTNTLVDGTTQVVAADAKTGIATDDIIAYDGINADKAVFTMNGKRFILADTSTAGDLDLSKLDKDITVISVENGYDGATSTQAIADQLSKATGMKVTASTDMMGDGSGVDGFIFEAGTSTSGQGGLTLQVGDTGDDFNKVTVSVDNLSAEGIGTAGLDVSTQPSSSSAIQTIKDAINQVSTNRANLGSLQNRLEHTINNLDTTAENMTAANSRIRDTDMAKEMMNYTKMNVLVQSAQAMLAQANQQPQSILQLLQ